MSKSIEEAKESRRDLLVQSNQNLKNTSRGKSQHPSERAKVEREQEKMAVGINRHSTVVSGKTIPPVKNNFRESPVHSGMTERAFQNSSGDGSNKVDLDVDDLHTAVALKIENINNSPPPSPDISKIEASSTLEVTRTNLKQSRNEPPSATKPRKKQKRQAPPKREGQQAGRWTAEEHELFLEGLKMHGREWKKVAEKITTRTSAQIRSHAQKYFSKLSKESGQLHPYDGYVNGPNHIASHSSSESFIDHNLDPSKSAFGSPYLSASVIKKIERIMKDPVQVENEVESTLKSLRERYLHLQLRLQAQEQKKKDQHHISTFSQNRLIPSSSAPRVTISVPLSKISTADVIKDPPSINSSPALPFRQMHLKPIQNDRTIGPATAALEQQQREEAAERKAQQFGSFVHGKPAQSSSSFTDSLASASPNREFGSEELIALQVLGGALGDSTNGDGHKKSPTSSLPPSTTRIEESTYFPSSKKQKTSELNTNDGP